MPTNFRAINFGFGIWICLLGLAASPAQADSVEIAKEVTLRDFQYKQLQLDMPAQALHLDRKSVLWVAGQKNLWRWDADNQTLKMLEFPSDYTEPKTKGLSDVLLSEARKAEVYMVAGSQLFQILKEPFRVVRRKLSAEAVDGSKNLALHILGNTITWVRSKSIVQIDRMSGEQTMTRLAQPLSSTDHIAVVRSHLWFARKNEIYRFPIGNPVSIVKVAEAHHPFIGLNFSVDSVYALTRHTVLRLGTNGVRIATIPVEGDRRLVSMYGGIYVHGYLLSDRLMEIYLLRQGLMRAYQLPLGEASRATAMMVSGSYVALLLDGQPRLFQISDRWVTALNGRGHFH